MRWPIRNQILFPFAGIVLLAVVGTSVAAALLAARQQERQTLTQLQQIVETLGQSSFPVTDQVLESMHGLSGAHFVACDSQGQLVAGTIPVDLTALPQSSPVPADEISRLSWRPALLVAQNRYFVARIERPLAQARFLYILYPESSWTRARWEAGLFPLSVGAAATLLTLVVAVWLAHRIGRRLHRLEVQSAAIAAGDFREIPVQQRDDELRDVELSVNRMAEQLRSMQSTIRQAEREQLLTQLAGGLAHSLRNAATGARLALQLHSRRCSAGAKDQSIDVALRQLALLETQVRGLLSLGRAESRPPSAIAVNELVADVASLVSPACEHAGVRLHVEPADFPTWVLCDPAALQAAVVNLVLNGIEAAGPRGEVALRVVTVDNRVGVEISDSGSGPSAEISATLFDPFVSTKREGVGLGLALARQVARDHGGDLDWFRCANRTTFQLTLPPCRPGSVAETEDQVVQAAP